MMFLHGVPFALASRLHRGCDMTYWLHGVPFFDEGLMFTYYELAGSIDSTSDISADLGMAMSLAGSIDAVSDISADLTYYTIAELAGLMRGITGITGATENVMELAGSMEGQSSITGILTEIHELSGRIDAVSDMEGVLGFYWETDSDTWNEWDDYGEDESDMWIPRVDESDDSWTQR